MAEAFRKGSTHRPLRAKAFTESAPVDFPTEFPGGVTFKMVGRATGTVVTGSAVGDALGNLTYQWATGNLNVIDTYDAAFTATDGSGRPEIMPTESSIAEPNLVVRVIAAL